MPRRRGVKVWRRRVVWKRDGGRCQICGRNCIRAEGKKKLTDDTGTIDHILPVSRGGTNRISNLQLLCYACNQAKGDDVAIDHDAVIEDVIREHDFR